MRLLLRLEVHPSSDPSTFEPVAAGDRLVYGAHSSREDARILRLCKNPRRCERLAAYEFTT